MDQLKPEVTPHTYIVKEISYFEWCMALAQYLKEKNRGN